MADFNPAHFLWRQEGRVGVITLNRPDRKNPLTFESYAELRDMFRDLLAIRWMKSRVLGYQVATELENTTSQREPAMAEK